MTNPIDTRIAKLRRRLALPFALTLGIAPAMGQSLPRCPAGKPLTLDQVTRFLDQKIPEDRTVGFIESCRVSFALDDNALDRLSAASAPTKVLDALNRVTAAGLTLDAAHAQAAALEVRNSQLLTPVNAERDAALAKLETDYRTQRAQAAHIEPKSEFETTADFERRKQQNDAKLAAIDRQHESERAQVVAEFDRKAQQRREPYRLRLEFLKSFLYPDPRPILYKSYDADSQILLATLGGEDYRFEKLPAAAARQLKEGWKNATAAQPFTEDGLKTRFLRLASAQIEIEGQSQLAIAAAAEKSRAEEIARGLDEAKTRTDRQDWNGARADYRGVLQLDPDNQAAKAGLATVDTLEQKQASAAEASKQEQLEFLRGLGKEGIWLDTHTQLMWTAKDSEHMVNFQAAQDYCQALQLGGLKQWRLPAIQELRPLYDPSHVRLNKTLALVEGRFQYAIKPSIELRNPLIWSSDRQGNDAAYRFNFHNGQVAADRLNSKQLWEDGLYMAHHALCVRPYNPVTDGLGNASPAPASPASETTPSQTKSAAETAPSAVPLSPSDRDQLTAQANKLYDAQRFAYALILYERTCASGNIYDCDRAGFMYSSGQGVPKDFAKAKTLESKACDGGNPFGCNNLGYLEQTVDKDYVNAAKHLAKACNGGNAAGCGSLAFQYEGGLGLPKDIAKAKELYAKSCKLGSQWSCQQSDRLQ